MSEWQGSTSDKRPGGTDLAPRDRLAAYLASAGYPRSEPAILQPAAIFLDQSGEDIRGRLYLTSDVSGAEYCLRPEYTIPVCLDYLASPQAGGAAAFSYNGPVFRYRDNALSEFWQAGLESFGRSDREAADAEILTLALGAVTVAGQQHLNVKIGDVALFTSLLEALDLPPAWRRRITRAHSQGKGLDSIVTAKINGTGTDHSGVLAALEGVDHQGAHALVEDLLAIAGISSVGGRTASEIADRFLEQAALQAGAGLPQEKRAILDRFLAIEGDPDQASAALRKLAQEARLDFNATLDGFDARLGFIAARGVDVATLAFATRFGRNLDYYTGFVFEAHDPVRPEQKPLIGGGRYDGLLQRLGAASHIPAVGAAIWTDRLQTNALGGVQA